MTKELMLARALRVMFSGSVVLGLGAAGLARAQTAPATPAATQATTPAAPDSSAAPPQQPMQRVEITGSSIRRAQAEGALPVQTVTHEDIQKLGVTSTEQLLTSITANSLVGATNVAQGAGASTYGESTASLRGIGASKTLILVNGRRLANYATDGTAVDINSIPLAAVDHVDVLKDGASGVYGSDAIAGVINFILRNNASGVELNAYTSGTKDGEGVSNKASIIAGWGDFDNDRYNITVSADIGKDQAIYGGARSYANQAWNNNGLREESATPSGNLSTFDPTTTPNAQGVIPNTLNSIGSGLGNPLSAGPSCASNGSQYDANLGACRYNPAPLVPLVPEVKRANLAGSLRFKLDDNNEAFAEGFMSHQTTTTIEQASPYNASFLAPDLAFVKANVYPAIILSPTSPYYPASYLAGTASAGLPVTVSYRAVDGGGREHEDYATLSHLVLGLRGTWRGYDYDAAYVHNVSDVSETTQAGYQSQLALVELLSNNNSFNPYAATQTPALAAQIYATNYVGPIINSVLSNDALQARMSGDLHQLPAGMMKFAVGGQLMDESLNLNPSTAYQSGDISGYGTQVLPVTAARHSWALFGELNVPIVEGLEGNLALRDDHYPTASSTNPKINFRYQPVSQLLVRASYGRGFREPALPELFNPHTFATTATFTDPVTGTTGQYNQVVGGNVDLKPEKSEQSSLGFVVDPIAGLSIAVDYWKINVRNLVTTYDPQFLAEQAAAGNPAYTGLVQRDSAGNISEIISTNINAGALKTAGFDLDARWRIARTDYGAFSARLNGTYTTKFDETLPDGTVQQSVAATIAPDGTPLNAVAAGGIVFRWRHQLTLDWKYQAWDAELTQNYQSGYYDNARFDSPTGTDAVRVGAFSTWDGQVAYTGIKNLTLRAGLKNMFNRKPPEAITLGQYFQEGYDPTYYDPHGMTGYLAASYKF